jgi:RNA polymerase sigma factor (sigma-70 family)
MRITLSWDAPGAPVYSLHREDSALRLLQSVRLYLALRRRHCDPGPFLSAAWERFYRTEAPYLLRLAREHARIGTDPQDGAQAIWQAIVTRLPNLRFDPEQGSIHGWVMTLARHVLIDQERLHSSHPTASWHADEVDRLPSPDPGPARLCELHEAQERVRGALAELRSQVSEASYRILHQHWIEGRSFATIAHDLGLTPKQVRDRHARMLRKLRPLLTRPVEGRSPQE